MNDDKEFMPERNDESGNSELDGRSLDDILKSFGAEEPEEEIAAPAPAEPIREPIQEPEPEAIAEEAEVGPTAEETESAPEPVAEPESVEEETIEEEAIEKETIEAEPEIEEVAEPEPELVTAESLAAEEELPVGVAEEDIPLAEEPATEPAAETEEPMVAAKEDVAETATSAPVSDAASVTDTTPEQETPSVEEDEPEIKELPTGEVVIPEQVVARVEKDLIEKQKKEHDIDDETERAYRNLLSDAKAAKRVRGHKKPLFSPGWNIAIRTLYFISVAAISFLIYSFDKHLGDGYKVLLYWGVFGVMVTVYRMELIKQFPWRVVFTTMAAFLSLKYLYWRTFETLIYSGVPDFLGQSALYLAELHGIIITLLSMFINIWPIYREELLIDTEDPNLPSVDIMIPTYTESEEIVKITATAALQVDYPKELLNVYICDDGGTVARRNNPKSSAESWERHYSLRKLANQLGVGYVTREKNEKAKSGNINHAMTKSEGDIILVLDCDHVPTRDILQRTIGYFLNDPDLYLVQTPHFFINPTPIEKNLETMSDISVENDMFFRIIHPGLDFWNASYFCGSAALLRRTHLEEIGGILGETITEDAETSIKLHGKGYNSVYVDHPMVCGLSPETFDDYITQRTRWAQGMMQLFILSNALTMKGLTIAQKLCYFNSSFFWFFSISRFIFFISPSLFLLFGLMVYNASINQIIIYALPYVFSTTLVMDFFFGKARQPFFSEIYESVQALFLVPAIISVLLNPRKPMFKVTPKGATIEQEYLNPLASSFLVVALVNMVALYAAVVKWFAYPLYHSVIMVTGVWCIYNLVIAIVSLGAFWERKQVRRYHRINTTGEVDVTVGDQTVHCEVKDISIAGLSFAGKFEKLPKLKDKASLKLTDEYGEVFTFNGTLQRVMERGGTAFCGVQFDAVNENFAKHVRYVYGNSYRWANVWERKSTYEGTFKLLVYLFVMGVKGFRDILVDMAKALADRTRRHLVRKWALDKAGAGKNE